MTSDQELHKLANDCLPAQIRIWVTHFFSQFGSSEPERAAFRAALRGGFGTRLKLKTHAEIGSDEEVEGDELWHHWAFTVFPASPEELVQASQLARKIAAAHGARERRMEDAAQPGDRCAFCAQTMNETRQT
jgi:hypothetical protein